MSQRATRLTMLYRTVAEPARTGTHWRPATDVYRTRDGWLLKFEAAGLNLEDINVSACGSEVTVSGVRRDQMEEGCTQYSMEISYSRFERTVHLPCAVEGAGLDVKYKKGILLVRVSL